MESPPRLRVRVLAPEVVPSKLSRRGAIATTRRRRDVDVRIAPPRVTPGRLRSKSELRVMISVKNLGLGDRRRGCVGDGPKLRAVGGGEEAVSMAHVRGQRSALGRVGVPDAHRLSRQLRDPTLTVPRSFRRLSTAKT